MDYKDFVKRIFEGLLIGIANIIPGVSGGTMALVTGIYDRLIHAINTVPLNAPISLLKGDGEEFKKKLKQVDYVFLVPLIIGIIIATLSLARVMEYLLENQTAMTYSFFIGLIIASVGIVYKYIEKIDIANMSSAAVGFIFAFLFVGLSSLETNHGLVVIFFSGAVAIISMILPGISGAFILVFLQQYDYMLGALNDLDIPVIITFLIGAGVGLFSFSKFLDYLLEKHKSVTMSFLFGLMLGALRVPVNESLSVNPPLYEIIIPAVIGAVMVIALELHYVSGEK